MFENLRQGALDSLLLDGIAAAYAVPVAAVRQAAMFTPDSGELAVAAATGGAESLAAFGLIPGRPVRPMLAASAPTVTAALFEGGSLLDRKLDGIRLQAHKTPDGVSLYTRSLDDITARLPEVVALVESLDCASAVLDGEALVVDVDGRARPFQETGSRTASKSESETRVSAYFFDLLALDGESMLDAPLEQRLAALDALVPVEHRVETLRTDDPAEAEEFFAATIAAGHEGVVVKDPAAPYAAGRRGAAWVKVKPRHTFDLVVLAVEWGSGRRVGLLSNLHLGARDPDTGGFVMLGKTFKGMTDEMLAWQTERFLGLETHREGHVVYVRPEQVVEIAIDGVQRSTRYPGGVALRFARVLRYRDDKTADEADTVEAVRTLGG